MGSIMNIPIASDASAASSRLLKADLLIVGRGEPVKNGALVWDENKILYAGPQSELPEIFASLKAVEVPVVMPGLWDCHIHLMGTEHFSGNAIWNLNQAAAGARTSRDCAEMMNAGYTSVRECAGHGIYVDKVIEAGLIIGPKIYSCASLLSQTGGHGDHHSIPVHTWLESCEHKVACHLCDGVDECMKGVRLQLRKGARFIKICASGGVTSDLDDPHHQQFSNAEIKAIVEEANRAERIVAAHCHGKPGILAALHAGVTTIEHGTELDDETIALMKEKNAMLVATRSIKEIVLKMGHLMQPSSYQKMLKAAPMHLEAYKKAINAGVRIAMGSDLGLSAPGSIAAHGANARELKYGVDAGMTPLQAIEAATATAPETLGPQAPLSGQLKEGYDADFIAVASNPLEDINVLVDQANITHVWRRGRLYKSPEAPIISKLLS